ncbi:MAG: ABC transporter ATP-binding protein [Chlamydiae bacterium]|nr:ABC transporter ATP-binding protein [Chlamydiota bacterium]MBI3276300.1 ABC transporter ATP-binding protein [Chlamydiota bacterium]
MSIEVKNLQKKFNNFAAVRDVSFSVKDGEFVTLLGPSGSGKSTILRCLAGLEIPTQGEVIINGENVTRIPVQDRKVGFVFQHYALFRHMSLVDNIAFGLRVRKVSHKDRTEKAKHLLSLIGLQGFEKRMPSQLSGGQRQRVALARALAPEPKLLLLDEPFGALDARLRKALRAWLRKLHDQIGLTTLLVTHDQDEAFELSDRVLVVNHGTIEQDAPPKKIFNQPATEFVATFVGETNRIEGTVHNGIVEWGPFKFLAPSKIAHLTKASILFRPIDVYVSSKPESSEVSGIIHSTRFLGAIEELKIDLEGNCSVTAQVPKGVALQSDFRVGKRVYVGITAVHIFPHNENKNVASV